MNELQEQYFEALTADRAKAAESLESFALSGVKSSVVEKYSDQAHFIYELLQNADDAKATTARFDLYEDKLVFAHNGTRRFAVTNPATEDQDLESGTLGDINAITAVGRSNKADESTIGKFGVGFKAVFQYTATPHIYDPDVSFKIQRFIVPIRIKEDYPGRREGETVFVFPFDHDTRSPEEAFADISEKLRSLDYPLLFLPNLRTIEFEVSGTLGLYGKSVEESRSFGDTTAEFIRLTQNDGDDRDDLYDDTLWLFTRSGNNGHTYSVGYFIDAEGRLMPKTHSAFCFFPTKEVTGLNFIIHAPFLLTDSREGIRAGIQHNMDLMERLAKLSADTLVYLRDIGLSKGTPLIDDTIFDIIPYDEKKFTEVGSKKTISFKPFYTAIKEAFETEAIIPSVGGYVDSSNAYWAYVPRIAELLSNEQLAVITGNDTAQWVFTTFGRQDTQRKNKPLTDYIDDIIFDRLDEDDILKGRLSKGGRAYEGGVTAAFIEAQPVEWLHNFYTWIGETKGRTDLIPKKPIFLDQDGKATAAFDEKGRPNLFLPVEGGNDYPTVNDALLANEETREFLKRLGVGEPSLRDEINKKILPKYTEGSSPDAKADFKKLFRFYQECPRSEIGNYLESLRETAFILCRSQSDETIGRGRADELYFLSDPLHLWFESKPDTKFVCFDEYVEIIGEDKKKEVMDFLTALGVADIPRVHSRELTYQEAMRIQRSWPHSTRSQRWTERNIDGCKEIIDSVVETQDSNRSVFIWKELLQLSDAGYFRDRQYNSQENVLFGRYNYFYYSSQSEKFESSEATRLRTLPWLMDIAGEFLPAGQLTRKTISPEYDISSDEASGLLHLLGIADEAADIDAEGDISSFGEWLGLSEDEQRQALQEFANKKKEREADENLGGEESEEWDDTGDAIESPGDDVLKRSKLSIQRVGKEITRRATSEPKERLPKEDDGDEDVPADEDDYSKPTADISKRIENVKVQAERDIQEIARLEDLKDRARRAKRYSYGWFKALLELEALNSGQDTMHSREISISFAKVEKEAGTSRILVLKHPSRYIPQSMEDLADIPLELHFAEEPPKRVAVEVVNVKSYTLRTKLRTNADIEGIDLSAVTEARIEARNPVFLIEELRKAFIKLGEDEGYTDDFDMKKNLCENIEFIFGPPGTGKTTHVARDIIIPMMQAPQDLKVLVLTPTNKAADVLVSRIMERMGEDQSYLEWLVRFGATNDTAIEQSGVFREKTFDIRTLPRSVTVTTIARFPYDYFLMDDGKRLTLSGLMWDCIIIDEASMIPLANIIYPLYKKTPSTFIISGDPFQIEPITTVDAWKDENIYTMVELKSFAHPKTVPHDYHVTLLTTQYRSIPAIGEVFSKFAYGGVLEHYRSSESQRSLPIGDLFNLESLNIIKFPVSKYESIYRPKRLQSKTPYQVYSALFAFEFVAYLASLIEIDEEEEIFRIGLIAPYRAQADLIDKLMASASFPKNVDVQVGTIHGFQGDECDIIVALFNPPPTITTHKDMFLNKLNIINVSISRARDYLIVLMPDDETENVENLTLVKKVEKLCKEQTTWSEQLSPAIEEIMFGSKTYLEDNTFSTTHQLVNVYGKPEKRYEVRSEDNAVDVQIHE